MPRARRRRYAVPLAATLAIIVGVAGWLRSPVDQAWGDSWGGALAGVGLIVLVLWALVVLARLGASAPPPPHTRQSAGGDAMGAVAGWLFQAVSLILVLGAIVGGIAWVAVRVYRLLP